MRTCHGRVDLMPLTWQYAPLTMQWCLDCHRNPERNVRPREQVFNMAWSPQEPQEVLGRRLVKQFDRVADQLFHMPQMKPYWRSLEALYGVPSPDPMEGRGVPGCAIGVAGQQASRRRFLGLMAASMSLAGMTGCTKQPAEFIYPYVDPPEQVIPGKPLYFATAIATSGLAQGVLVESHEGRPTKVEGNPEHPASLGATDVLSQAAVLDLYDPDRLKAIRGPNGAASWGEFQLMLQRIANSALSDGGARIRLLGRTVASRTLAARFTRS